MTLAEALDIVVARTGHRRYRELCDPAHPDYNPDYIPVVIRLAEAAAVRIARDGPAPRVIVVDYGTDSPRPCGGCPGF